MVHTAIYRKQHTTNTPNQMNTYNYIDPISNKTITVTSKKEYSHIVLCYGATAAERGDGLDYSNTIVAQSLCSTLKRAQARVESPKDLIIALTKVG